MMAAIILFLRFSSSFFTASTDLTCPLTSPLEAFDSCETNRMKLDRTCSLHQIPGIRKKFEKLPTVLTFLVIATQFSLKSRNFFHPGKTFPKFHTYGWSFPSRKKLSENNFKFLVVRNFRGWCVFLFFLDIHSQFSPYLEVYFLPSTIQSNVPSLHGSTCQESQSFCF